MNINEIFNLEMMNHHKNVIKESIQNFELALNSGNIESVLSFYSEDAVFMPDGFSTLKKGEIGRSRSNFLTEKDFKIKFDNLKIDVKDNFGFVEAVANTSEIDPKGTSKVQKTSRDFFVLRQEENQWKIFSYIFNNVTVSQAS
ncbi:YybH family protein [Chryseobacterium luquanense]|uniref:Nuclear transport factor 2 family protein n=1 Tax=Chryseobacterium luquanense TaxID=2983766 RepID=A0ABT3Y7J8_9FLAO|nr:nuclear transport factor 2 family protein [Chryseobacterium luquanense]MCX8534131.1 nuclear transport factor 2 family protein [Chryseobacterium luquanense]